MWHITPMILISQPARPAKVCDQGDLSGHLKLTFTESVGAGGKGSLACDRLQVPRGVSVKIYLKLFLHHWDFGFI